MVGPRAHLPTDADGQCVTRVGGPDGAGRGEARRQRTTSPRSRPEAQQSCGRPVPRSRPSGAAGGAGSGAGVTRLWGGSGQAWPVLRSPASGRLACCMYASVPDSGWLLLGTEGFRGLGRTSAHNQVTAQRKFFHQGTVGALQSTLQGGFVVGESVTGVEYCQGEAPGLGGF